MGKEFFLKEGYLELKFLLSPHHQDFNVSVFPFQQKAGEAHLLIEVWGWRHLRVVEHQKVCWY